MAYRTSARLARMSRAREVRQHQARALTTNLSTQEGASHSMARLSRPLKTAFWEDDKVCRLSRDARLTLAGLITKIADDEGRFVATPSSISGSIFPHDNLPPARVAKWLVEIEVEGMVQLYKVNGGTYGCLNGWAKHQKPPHPSPSTIPGPSRENS